MGVCTEVRLRAQRQICWSAPCIAKRIASSGVALFALSITLFCPGWILELKALESCMPPGEERQGNMRELKALTAH